MTNTVLVCSTCGQGFPDGLPEGAVELTPDGRGRIRSYRFADNSVHHLRKVLSCEAKHNRWHKTKKVGCEFCFPPPEPEPPVEQEVEVVEVVPEPIKPEVAEPHVDDDESLTSMQMAFRKINRR